ALAHSNALTQLSAEYIEVTMAAQQQAAEDAVAVGHAQAGALAHRDVGDSQRAVATELISPAGAFSDAKGANDRYQAGLGTAAEVTAAMSRASSAPNTELDLLLGRFLSADQATNAFEQGLMDMGQQLMANGFAFDENTKAG